MNFRIRATHRYGYRSGQWARVLGVDWVEHENGGRPCYMVEFPDGVFDRWPIYDESEPYEFEALT